MARFISRRNPISTNSLKRKALGTVAIHHDGNWETVRFTRCRGGWLRQRTDFIGSPAELVSSATVARECNMAFGYKDSWAEVCDRCKD